MRFVAVACLAALVLAGEPCLNGQGSNAFLESPDHPAIGYTTRAVSDPVSQFNNDIATGKVDLPFDRSTGYLSALLAGLHVPVESQGLVFSETSAQAAQITPENPRAIFFNDRTAIGWTRGTGMIEIADQDPQQGVIFYTLEQKAVRQPELRREQSCLLCHLSPDTLGVPGLLTISTFPMSDDKNAYASGIAVDDRTPVDQRWGGWYVTGRLTPRNHLGNRPVIRSAQALKEPAFPAPRFESVEGQFDTTGYPSRFSDIAALMVLNHQTQAMNLLTRLGWEARLAEYQKDHPPTASRGVQDKVVDRVGGVVMDLVDYLLFVDEAPITTRMEGSSGFTEMFAAQGPRDSKGRSLRDLDLNRRLMRYPCSYMIYTPAFDALPESAKRAVYQRLWDVLSGREQDRKYKTLSLADRQAVVEILRETKADLPAFFRPVARR